MTPEVEKNTPGGLLAARRHQNLGGLKWIFPVEKPISVELRLLRQQTTIFLVLLAGASETADVKNVW